ncbi:MAG: hypothetical protein HW380_2571 [Magnetococcales bacterium]|nr:hypothetical protein [Magnetococcales bacterium]
MLSLQIPVEVLMTTQGQQSERPFRVFVFIGKQSRLMGHFEFENPNSSQIAHFGFTNDWIGSNGTHSLIQIAFLVCMQPFDRILEKTALKNTHQSNLYSSNSDSSRARRISLIME